MKDVDLGEPTSFRDHVYLGCIQRECKTNKDIVDNYRAMFESRMSAGGTELFIIQRTLKIANWRTKLLNNDTQSQLHELTTINSKKKKWDLLESVGELSKVCSQIVLK